ncbi:NADP-dependent oxidoreductase domain-containing protein [Melanogaster broomeanus]|nr:NADP-dependent oxidoreductase domain-containing protein [Melanogaster broomeanus]
MKVSPLSPLTYRTGYYIPSIAFGTWTLGNGQGPIDQVEQALDNGFNHIDTAQSYRNEGEAGTALHESGLSRSDVFITTKYSGTNGLDINTSIHNSVENLGVDYVDLYLIHAPSLAKPDIPTAWATMEKIKEAGLARSIGVSNFDEKDLQILVESAKIKPAVNQILLHPYVYRRQLPTLEYAAANGIAGGPLDAPLNAIASRLGATTDQVLLAWTKAKGAVVVTTSSKKTRLQGYLAAGDIELTQEDVAAIDAAGALGAKKVTLRRLVTGALVGAAVFGACSYFNIRIF